ncbi:MAG: DUF354 domain-containing protein [Mucilaginibacter sp.]
MRIWIDIINSPQVSFFVPFINDFRKNGHEILVTCRDSGNTVDLLKQNNIEFHIVGERQKNLKEKKIRFFIKRLCKLYSFIRKQKIDVAASQSSFYQPIVARMLGIPCLYTNDNEHAKGNLFGFLFATKVILPVALKNESFTKKWPLRSKVVFYPSVKEAIYLSQNPELLNGLSQQKNKIYFRPEPWTAQYYDGPQNFFDNTLLNLLNEYDVIVLPRDKSQAEHYTQDKFGKLTVAQKPLNLQNIISDCLLFIGAGGSMSRELAVMGIPVISIYQADLLCVDKYLVDRDRLKVDPNVNYDAIKSMLNSNLEIKKEWVELNEGKESYSIIKDLVVELNR